MSSLTNFLPEQTTKPPNHQTTKMKRILEFIVSGCWHQWEIEEQHSVARFNSVADYILDEAGVPARRKIVATVDVLRCSKCKAVRYQKNNLLAPMKETP